MALFRILTPIEIETAMKQNRIEVWFQPQRHLVSGRVESLEALLRFRTKAGDILGPEAFIPTAEESGQIAPLTAYALEESARWSASWRKLGWPLRVSVNLSKTDLVDLTWPDRAAVFCAQQGVAPTDVTFELTESSLTHETTALLDGMTELRTRGFRLSLDDFGSGQTSLHELRSLPFDELKLDRQLIVDALVDPRAWAMLESSVAVASELGMQIVAEGIETEEMLQRMAQLGCHAVQGFYVATAMPGSDTTAWLTRQ